MNLLSQTFYGNTLYTWLLSACIFLLVYLCLLILRQAVVRRLAKLVQRTRTGVDDFIHSLVDKTQPLLLFFLALYAASLLLALPEKIAALLRLSAIIAFLLQVALWGLEAINYWVKRRLQSGPRRQAVNATSLGVFSLIAKIALWSIIILLILENVTGIEVNALITSLGITGVAVALAVQNILGDVFASLSIALDKPFVIGDTIQVDEFTGVVENIGLKSTRLRSVSGEQLIFSNSDLLNSRLRNLARMAHRTVVFSFNVSYDTPQEKLARIPDLVETIIRQQERVQFERAHLRELGSFALRYECSFTIEIPDLTAYLNAQQSIFLALLQGLDQEGIHIALANPPVTDPSV